MGSNSSKQQKDELFPAATQDEIAALQDEGKLLCVATPTSDIVEGHHNLATMFYAEYENGTELTLLFTEETQHDNILMALGKPFLGQKCDLVTIFILNDDTVEFPNTHSGNQTWETKRPRNRQKTVDVGKFEKRNGNLLLVWVNTSNHLLSERNSNEPKREGEEYKAFFWLPATGDDNPSATDYVVRKGSRDEVDAHFKGIVRSVAKLMTPAQKKRLGKRLL